MFRAKESQSLRKNIKRGYKRQYIRRSLGDFLCVSENPTTRQFPSLDNVVNFTQQPELFVLLPTRREKEERKKIINFPNKDEREENESEKKEKRLNATGKTTQ